MTLGKHLLIVEVEKVVRFPLALGLWFQGYPTFSGTSSKSKGHQWLQPRTSRIFSKATVDE